MDTGIRVPGHQNWLPLLKRIRDGGKLCQIYVSPANALTVAKEIGGKGFAFYIVPEEPYTDAGLNEYFDVLANPRTVPTAVNPVAVHFNLPCLP